MSRASISLAVRRAAILIAQEAAGLPERIHAAAWLAENETETVRVLSRRLAILTAPESRAVEIFERAAAGDLGVKRPPLLRHRAEIIKSLKGVNHVPS
jgi:hypothetical protein